MRKWTYLVATLLMAGTTATFTGCIDTDEPEGIVDLRGAKSELIKAQAAVKLVEVEWQKAQVAYQELVNKSKELDNQYKEYDVQMHALDVKLKELEVERAQAVTEQAKAEADAKIAEANRNKAFWENKMAEEAEIFKAAMLNYQTQTAQAQEAYDNAMKLIEAGKLLLTDGEKAIINKAQLHLESAATAMNGKYLLLKKAQIEYNAAITDPTTPTLESLQALLKQAQIAVEKNEIILKEKENLLALAEDFDAAEWDAKYLEMKKKQSEYQSLQDKAEVKKAEIEKSADYKAAEKNVADKKELQKAAQKAYFDDSVNPNAGAKADSTAATLTDRTIKEYTSEPIESGLKDLFKEENSFKTLVGYNYKTGIFSYTKGTYTQKAYDEDSEKDVATRTNDASVRERAVKGWITTLIDYTVDENGVEWNKLSLADLEKKAKTAETTFNGAKDKWDISVKAVKGTATTVPTVDLKKATDDYNSSYATVVSAVNAYNAAYDAVYTAGYNDAVDKAKTDQLEQWYRDAMIKVLSADAKKEWDALENAKKTTSKLEELLNDTKKQAEAKVEADKLLATWLKLENTVKELDAKGKAAGNTALAEDAKIADNKGKVPSAQAALTKAVTDATKKITSVTPAIDAYKALAATPYGQVVKDVVTIKDMTGDGDFYEKEVDKDKNPTGHLKALRSDISADEFKKLSTTKLDNTTALKALTSTSNAAFGDKKISSDDRLLEVTEPMVRTYIKNNPTANLETEFGALGAMMYANDNVQTCNEKIKAVELIKALIAQLDVVSANLDAEIAANTALMEPFIKKAAEALATLDAAKAEVKKAEAAKDALTAEVDAEITKNNELAGDYQTLAGEVQKQIDGIKGDVTLDEGMPVTVESILNYWKKAVADQEVILETNKQAQTSAEKNIELFNKGEFTQAYVVEQKKITLDTATAIYDAAKAVYDDALAEVKAVLEALTK